MNAVTTAILTHAGLLAIFTLAGLWFLLSLASLAWLAFEAHRATYVPEEQE